MADTGSKIVSLNVLSSYDKKRDLLNDDKFVAQEKDKSLMDVTEHDKLADIEENAQVNAIESISVDGTPLTIDADKNVDIDLTGKVDVETGKSLVDDDLITQITTNKDDIETLNGDEKTTGSVKKQIADAVGGITEFDTKVVATLPATGQKGIIYFVPKADAKPGDDTHDEYIWVSEKFEKVGNTEVNLEDYAKTADVVLKDDVDEDTLALLTTKEEGDKKTLLFDGKEIETDLGDVETKGEMMTKAQYDALESIDPDKNYYITDATSSSVIDPKDYVKKEIYENKVGVTELTTTAKDLSGAVNEINTSLTYNAGDVTPPLTGWFAGVVASSATAIIIAIPLDKAINADKVELISGDITLRHTAGYAYIADASTSAGRFAVNNISVEKLKQYCDITVGFSNHILRISVKLKTGKYTNSDGVNLTTNWMAMGAIVDGVFEFS